MEDEGSGWSVAFETAKSVAYLGQGKTVQYNFLRVAYYFWILCFFLVDCLGGWNQ